MLSKKWIYRIALTTLAVQTVITAQFAGEWSYAICFLTIMYGELAHAANEDTRP